MLHRPRADVLLPALVQDVLNSVDPVPGIKHRPQAVPRAFQPEDRRFYKPVLGWDQLGSGRILPMDHRNPAGHRLYDRVTEALTQAGQYGDVAGRIHISQLLGGVLAGDRHPYTVL